MHVKYDEMASLSTNGLEVNRQLGALLIARGALFLYASL